MIGCTPLLASFSENSSAPNRLLVSVIASAGMELALASLASVSMVERPLAQRIGAVDVQMHETDGFQNRGVHELRVHGGIFASAGARVEPE